MRALGVVVLLLVGLWLGAAGCRREPAPAPDPMSKPMSKPLSEQTETGAYAAFRKPAVLVAALGLVPGSAVADVGAGGGLLTLPLLRAVGPSGRVVATDVDEAALSALRERADRAGQHTLQTRRVAADQPGLEPGAYDLILLSHVDHLLPDRAAYLRALLPALRPGGRVVVCNRQDRAEPLRAALQSAGLTPRPIEVDLPGQFLWELRPR